MSWRLSGFAAALLFCHTTAFGQTTNPPTGSVWTYQGPSTGPGWTLPVAGMNPDIWAVLGTHPPAGAWMNTEIPITGGAAYKYMVPISSQLTMNTPMNNGQIAITGASRSIDSSTTCCTIGGAFVAINDNTTKVQSVWPLYVSGARMAGTGSLQIEVDMANLDPAIHDVNPYSGGVGTTVPLYLQSGGEAASPGGPTLYDTSAMLVLNTNGATTRHGIVFGSGLFDYSYCYQQTCPAIDMPAGDEIRWSYDPTDAYGSYIRGLNTTAGSGNGIVLTASGTVFTNAQGTQLAAVQNTPGMSTGGFVELGANGLNAKIGVGTNGATNSNLELDAYGTGVIVLNAPVQYNSPTVNPAGGPVQTFTNSPCANLTSERWLPVVLQGLGTWYYPLCQ